MFKQVIVVNKSLNMSPGKMSAMVAHGSIAFLTNWIKRNICTEVSNWTNYIMKPNTMIDKELYANWICNGFTKIILEVNDEKEMEELIHSANRKGFVCDEDYFNIVDSSTEFYGIPRWAVIAFKPMEAEKIDILTGELKLYGYETKVFKDEDENDGYETLFNTWFDRSALDTEYTMDSVELHAMTHDDTEVLGLFVDKTGFHADELSKILTLGWLAWMKRGGGK